MPLTVAITAVLSLLVVGFDMFMATLTTGGRYVGCVVYYYQPLCCLLLLLCNNRESEQFVAVSETQCFLVEPDRLPGQGKIKKVISLDVSLEYRECMYGAMLYVHVCTGLCYKYMYVRSYAICTCMYRAMLYVHVCAGPCYMYMYVQGYAICTCMYRAILHVLDYTVCVCVRMYLLYCM